MYSCNVGFCNKGIIFHSILLLVLKIKVLSLSPKDIFRIFIAH